MEKQMDASYYNGKKTLALENIRVAISSAEEAARLIENASYSAPHQIHRERLHELLDFSARRLTSCRIYFEKTQWASANSGLEFNDWLGQNGYPELDDAKNEKK